MRNLKGVIFWLISIGSGVTSDPAVVSCGANRIDVFIRRIDDAVWHKWWDGSNWYPSHDQWTESRGGILTSDPSVVSWGANRIDVFARGSDNGLYHIWWDGDRWSNEGDINNWERRGGILTSDPSVVSWGANRIDVFARGSDNGLYHIWWDGDRWSNEEDLNYWEYLGRLRSPLGLTSDLAVTSERPNSIWVFVRSSDNMLFHKYWHHNYEWSPSRDGFQSYYNATQAILASAPVVVPRTRHLFFKGIDNALWVEFNAGPD